MGFVGEFVGEDWFVRAAQCEGCIAGQGAGIAVPAALAGAPEVQGQGLQEPLVAGGNDRAMYH